MAIHGDIGPIFIVRFVLREMGDVAGGVVREVGGDAQLLLGVGPGETFLGMDGNRGGFGEFLGVVGKALFDPADDGLVIGGVFLQAGTSLVGDFAGGFEEEERVFRGGPEDAAAAGITNEIIVVVPGFVAKEGELEAVLAVGFSVAASAVAAVFGKDGDEVVGEGNGGGFVRGDLDRLCDGEVTVGGGEGGFAGGEDGDQAVGGDSDDVGRIGSVGGGVGEIA